MTRKQARRAIADAMRSSSYAEERALIALKKVRTALAAYRMLVDADEGPVDTAVCDELLCIRNEHTKAYNSLGHRMSNLGDELGIKKAER